MASVGVRELRQRASQLLRRVENGEIIDITDRGRPVALLGPLSAGSPLEQMRRRGDIEPASAALDDLPRPLPSRAAEPPSAVLARLRRDDR